MNSSFEKGARINEYLRTEEKAVYTINDLRSKLHNGETLSADERKALANFDKYKIAELNKQPNDTAFHKRFKELQIVANLGNYEEFLKEQYGAL
jgi:Ni/Co efflux regulator RcnB